MQLREYLEQHVQLEANYYSLIDDIFDFQEFEEGDTILKTGEISDKIYFIESGIIREFSYIESESESESESEKIITHWILPENEWIYQVESFELGIPSRSKIKALTKVKARSISKNNFNLVLEQDLTLSNAIIAIYRRYLLQLEYRNRMHQLRKVEDRLDFFEQLHPGLSNQIPQYLIASFLNTTPSNLSKVRNRRMHKLKPNNG